MSPNRIKKLRKRLGMSQRAFADVIGCRWASVSRWENGVARPIPIYQRLLSELEKKAKAKKAA